jgi:hypothetical protein
MNESLPADLSPGSQDPEPSEAPTITYKELVGRAALIHAAIDEYEMKASDESRMKKRAEERAP